MISWETALVLSAILLAIPLAAIGAEVDGYTDNSEVRER